MKGIFEDTQQIETFTTPLKTLGSLAIDSGICIALEKENDKVESLVTVVNKQMGVRARHKWKTLFNDFEMDNETEVMGIYKPAEFISLFTLFNDEKIEFEFKSDEDKIYISNESSDLIFATADAELLSFEKKLKIKWDKLTHFGTYEYDLKKMSNFKKAMSVLGSQEFVYMNGDSTKGKLKLSVRGKNAKKNNFSVTVDADIENDFESIYKKEALQNILSLKSDKITLDFYDRLLKIETSTDEYETQFYVTKAIMTS